ncbi:MAG: LysR family transcriptional regulator [Pseudomonadota bacterium]
MASTFDSLDWSLVRAYLAVAETGSLSAAARKLGASQPTVGRQVQAMEEALGAVLFHRRARGMVLTEMGGVLLAPARAMRDAAGALALTAAGVSDSMAGTVRVTASVFASHHVLPPIIARIRAAEPEIAIELAPSDETENLLFREADIAVRMYRPTQLDVITKHLGDIELGLYGSPDLFARYGRPTCQAELERIPFVGYDRSERIIRGFREAGWHVDRDFFKVRCDSQTAYWELVRAGCGLGFASKLVAARDPLLEEVDLGIPIPSLPVWLTAHETMRRTPRVRRVYQMLGEGLSDLFS